MKKIYRGAKYYKPISDNEYEILRVMNDKDENNFKCAVGNTMNRKRISRQELDDEYTRLTPDGVLYLNIVNIQEIQDVILMLYRTTDVDEGKSDPYCVCRQNITDLFANVLLPKYENLICGISVTADTIPENISMKNVMSCDSLTSSIGVCVYRNDTMDDLFKLFRSKEYDNVLCNLFTEHVRYKYKDDMREYLMKRHVDGYCKNLKDLMMYNEFMYDFYTGFKVYPMDIEITRDEIKNGLSLYNRAMLSSIVLKNITKTLVIPYNEFVDITKVQKDCVLVQDRKSRTFLIGYVYDGLYEVPVQDIESAENIEKLSKIKGYANNPAAKALRFNKEKYEQ